MREFVGNNDSKGDLSNNAIMHVKKNGIEYLQFKRLLQYDDLKHVYALKPQNYKTSGDRITKSDYEKAIRDYKFLCNELNIDINSLIKPNQEHTDKIEVVTEINGMDIETSFRETDGLITDKDKTTLVTTNADCILLLFYDPIKKVIANVHSGWKGTCSRISEKTVKEMVLRFNCNPNNIICCISPSIRKCHFEVEKDVKNIFKKEFAYTNRIEDIIKYKGKENGKDKWMIDTILINKIILKDCGLHEENIVDSGICSVCNSDKIHSYRVEGINYGLCTAMISRVKRNP